jgi:hypothetical protein
MGGVTVGGTVEIYYRHDGLPSVGREEDVRQKDYDRVGAAFPMQEFDSMNQILDHCFWHFENGGLPRQARAHDVIAYQVRGFPTRALLVVDVKNDINVFAGDHVPLERREVYRDPDMVLALWHTDRPWRLGHELRVLR